MAQEKANIEENISILQSSETDDKIKQETKELLDKASGILDLVKNTPLYKKFQKEYQEVDRLFDESVKSEGKIVEEELNKIKTEMGDVLLLEDEIKKNKIKDDFNLGETSLATINQLEEKFNFDVYGVIKKYQDFIETELQLGDQNTLEKQKHQKLIDNVKKIIGLSIGDISNIIEEVQEKNNGSLENTQWIINDRIATKLEKINDIVLASAKFYIQMHNPNYVQKIDNYEPPKKLDLMRLSILPKEEKEQVIKDYQSKLIGNVNPHEWSGVKIYKNEVLKTIETNLLASEVNTKTIGRLPFNDNRVTLINRNNAWEQALLELGGDKTTIDEFEVDFLCEEDKEVEAYVSLAELPIVMAEIGADTLTGGLSGILVDGGNVIKEKDWSLEAGQIIATKIAKKLKLPNSDKFDTYQREKTPMDRILAAGTAIPIGGEFLKTPKVIKLLKKVSKLSPKQIKNAIDTLDMPVELKNEFAKIIFSKISNIYKKQDIYDSKKIYKLSEMKGLKPMMAIKIIENFAKKIDTKYLINNQDRIDDMLEIVVSMSSYVRKDMDNILKMDKKNKANFFYGYRELKKKVGKLLTNDALIQSKRAKVKSVYVDHIVDAKSRLRL